jgi:hypothetical protein
MRRSLSYKELQTQQETLCVMAELKQAATLRELKVR